MTTLEAIAVRIGVEPDVLATIVVALAVDEDARILFDSEVRFTQFLHDETFRRAVEEGYRDLDEGNVVSCPLPLLDGEPR